jgi:hypothetical protein
MTEIHSMARGPTELSAPNVAVIDHLLGDGAHKGLAEHATLFEVFMNAARSEGRKAADTALSERVAELERGLEAFAECADIAEEDAEGRDGEDPVINVRIAVSASFRGAWGQVCVLDSNDLIDDFRRARTLLTQPKDINHGQ